MKPLLRAWHRLFPSRPEPTRPGRPVGSGYWADAEDFEREFWAAIAALEESDRRPTQADVARILACSPRTLSRRLRAYGISWTEATRRSFSGKL